MRRADILVINPNSNPAVTAGLDAALDAFRLAGGPSIRCTTLAEGPFGIESQRDVEQVTLPLRRLVEQDNAADAFVIACFSDPGLQVCREATQRPVFGINECGVLYVPPARLKNGAAVRPLPTVMAELVPLFPDL